MKVFKNIFFIKINKGILFIFSFFILTSCNNYKSSISKNKYCTIYSCINKTINITIYTNKGNLNFDLYGNHAPVTVGNFIKLVRKSTYENTNFFNIIKDPYPFTISGGRPSLTVNDENKKNLNIEKEISFIPLEIKIKDELIPRYGYPVKDTNEIKNIILKHEKGTISMSRFESYNSASNEFFITLRSLPVLDGRYSVFGKLISGFRVLENINKNDFIKKITINR